MIDKKKRKKRRRRRRKKKRKRRKMKKSIDFVVAVCWLLYILSSIPSSADTMV